MPAFRGTARGPLRVGVRGRASRVFWAVASELGGSNPRGAQCSWGALGPSPAAAVTRAPRPCSLPRGHLREELQLRLQLPERRDLPPRDGGLPLPSRRRRRPLRGRLPAGPLGRALPEEVPLRPPGPLPPRLRGLPLRPGAVRPLLPPGLPTVGLRARLLGGVPVRAAEHAGLRPEGRQLLLQGGLPGRAVPARVRTRLLRAGVPAGVCLSPGLGL